MPKIEECVLILSHKEYMIKIKIIKTNNTIIQ